MKRVIRIVRAVPWRGIARFSFKALSLLAIGIAAVTVFVIRLIAVGGGKSEEAEDDSWAAYQPGARKLRPDLAPYGTAEDD